MTTKEITINGKNYPVVFNMKTMSNFEEIIEKGFFEVNLNTTKNRMALIMSAVLAADNGTELKIEDMFGQGDWDAYMQITTAYSVVMKLADEFFPIPKVEKKNDGQPSEEETEDEGSKN